MERKQNSRLFGWGEQRIGLLRTERPASLSLQLALALAYWSVIAFLLFVFIVRAEPKPSSDLTEFSLEQLINLDVYSASKFSQKVSDAPSAVTVVTSADIKAYGYRKLIDILKSIRGIYSRYDRNYDFIGVRGFGRPGDYNSRFLLLVDGYRINDAVYDTATVGTEFLLDVDLIERVEFVPGPGSSIYGSNAFFGVVNVITRQPKAINGLESSIEVSSYGTNKSRFTYGKRLDNGIGLVLSGSFYDSKGQSLYFSEFDTPENNNGVTRHSDYDHYAQTFAKFSYESFTLTTAFSERKKGIPTGAYGTIFNDPNSYSVDTQAFADLTYNRNYREHLNVMARVYYGYYPYDGNYPYVDSNTGNVVTNKDASRPVWWGGELKIVDTKFDRHKLVYGAEYRQNKRQDQFNYDVDPHMVYTDDRRSSTVYGVYLQDEYTLRKDWIINAGLRFDDYGMSSTITNPRLGLIYKPDTASAIKFLYGTAFRAPNAYELYRADAGEAKANPDLKPERIKTYEMILERYYGNRLRLMAGLFYYKTRDLINLTVDPVDNLAVFKNLEAVSARGAEFEIEQKWNGGARVRASLTLQKTTDSDSGQTLSNSPKALAKFNGSTPLFDTGIQSGLEVQYTSSRKTTFGTAGGYSIANLTLLGTRLPKGLEISATAYNLFDKKYADPAGDDLAAIGLDAINQDGRSYRFQLTYHF